MGSHENELRAEGGAAARFILRWKWVCASMHVGALAAYVIHRSCHARARTADGLNYQGNCPRWDAVSAISPCTHM